MGPPKISLTTRARMLKLKIQLDIVKYSLWVKKISPIGASRGVGPPSVNLGPPNISENTRARKLKLKMPLDIVKYWPRVQKFFPLGAYKRAQGPLLKFGFPLKPQKLLQLEC